MGVCVYVALYWLKVGNFVGDFGLVGGVAGFIILTTKKPVQTNSRSCYVYIFETSKSTEEISVKTIDTAVMI